jgi:hypothetical protein
MHYLTDGEVTLWINRVILSARQNVRFYSDSDPIAAFRPLLRRARPAD